MPISPYGHNDMGSDAEWDAYHARIRREQKESGKEMSIAETFKDIPDDAEIHIVRDTPGLGRTVQSWGNDGSVKRLKKHFERHEALLAAAKEVESEVVVVGKMSVDAFAKMQRAIAACEGLGE